jgi:hypothetical protein
LTYPQSLDVIENESLEFPTTAKKISKKNISLLRISNGLVMEDCIEQVEFLKQDVKYYNLVRFNNLAVGEYELNLKKDQKKIKITIHRGTYWESDGFILKRNCLFENKNVSKMVKIASVKSK